MMKRVHRDEVVPLEMTNLAGTSSGMNWFNVVKQFTAMKQFTAVKQFNAVNHFTAMNHSTTTLSHSPD